MHGRDGLSDAAARPNWFPWPPVLLVSLAGAAFGLGQLHLVAWPGMNDLPARIIGLGVGAGGIALMAWAIMTMARAKTNILPHRAADVLVTSGPFARFRNPIYLADTMMLLGLAELTTNVWFVGAAAVFVAAVTWLAILPEERHLEARFGDAYRAYKAKSRRWI